MTTFYARIKNGRLVSRVLSHIVKESGEGDRFIFTVEEDKPNRTTLQNRYYNFYLRLIAKETGSTRDYLHEFFKMEILGTQTVTLFGVTKEVAPSTIPLSKQEFSDYMEKIETMTGIPLPPPEEFCL